jgi:hypothetical protein
VQFHHEQISVYRGRILGGLAYQGDLRREGIWLQRRRSKRSFPNHHRGKNGQHQSWFQKGGHSLKHYLTLLAVLAFAASTFAQEQSTKAQRDQFARDVATDTTKAVGHAVEAVTSGSQSEVLVVRDKAIHEVRAGFGFFSKDVGLQLAGLGFREVYLTNGVQWWCNVPIAKSETGWWTFGVGGPFKSDNEAASNLRGLAGAVATKPEAPPPKGPPEAAQRKQRSAAEEERRLCDDCITIRVVKASLVTITTTDASGKGLPLQRLIVAVGGQKKGDGMSLNGQIFDGNGATADLLCLQNCFNLTVGSTYRMRLGRLQTHTRRCNAVYGDCWEYDNLPYLSIETANGIAAWQILELCSGRPGEACLALSTVNSR